LLFRRGNAANSTLRRLRHRTACQRDFHRPGGRGSALSGAGGLAAWTLLEYLVHRFVFHRYSSVGRRLHQLHHDHPNDPDAERSSLSTPLIAFPIGFLLIATAGVEDGSAIFAGLLLGYLAFITVHYALHRWPIGPNSWLYSAKLRHLTHHRFENCNFGVTTIFWDIVFRTYARIIGERLPSGAG
jgi:sterol desaturase/sphingolipid hydroxylase (fatty acid hydroxylase superfamily)